MPRLIRVLCLSFVALACSETPCFAQRSGAPNDVCQGLANVPTAICMDGEAQKKDKELRAFVDQVRETLEPADQKKLTEAQKAWDRYRKLTCDIDGSVYFGSGSGKSTEDVTCFYVETDLQIKDLHAIFDWEMRPH